MRVHTLQAGDEVLLDEGVRLRVVAVEGNSLLLELSVADGSQVVRVEARRVGVAGGLAGRSQHELADRRDSCHGASLPPCRLRLPSAVGWQAFTPSTVGLMAFIIALAMGG
jgi:hypothetical protein